MKKHEFKKIGDWYLNLNGKLDIDFPSSLSNTLGVIAMTIEDEAVFLSSTIHYGPRIKDFKHTKNGETTKARIHNLIEQNLKKGKRVTVWVKDTPAPRDEKNELIRLLNPIWNK